MKISIFCKKSIACFLLSIITAILYQAYINLEFNNSNISLECELEPNTSSSIDLYSDYGKGFNEEDKKSVDLSPQDRSALFTLDNKEGKSINRIRLDFNSQNSILLKKINFYKESTKWFTLDDERIYEKISFVSEKNSMLKTKEGIIIAMKTNDFYISFVDTFNLVTSNFLKSFLLLWSWILFFGIFIMKELQVSFLRKDYLFFFISLFILSIFFKEAWTTFTVLLMGILGIINYLRSKRFEIQYEQIALIIFFILILVFGKVVSYKQINVQLGLLIIPLFLAFNNQIIKKEKLYEFYCNVFVIFMNILITSFVISVFVYDEIDLLSFFETKKTIIGNITYWVVYNNATFLSFFILLGIVFSNFLFSSKLIHRNYYLAYLILSLISIYILGSRIALVIYFVLILITQLSIKWIVPICLLFFLSFYQYVFTNIHSIDYYRSIIWEKTLTSDSGYFLGNGLGSSQDLFLNFKNQYISENINHPHNQYITYRYELGILGIILLGCLFVYYGVLYFFKNEKDRLSVLFLLLMLMITESPFETSKPLLLFAFFISIHTQDRFFKKKLLK